MRTFIGIDLGSTTTKAVLMDENRTILGRGITNSRSNYDVAARVSKQEAKISATSGWNNSSPNCSNWKKPVKPTWTTPASKR